VKETSLQAMGQFKKIQQNIFNWVFIHFLFKKHYCLHKFTFKIIFLCFRHSRSKLMGRALWFRYRLQKHGVLYALNNIINTKYNNKDYNMPSYNMPSPPLNDDDDGDDDDDDDDDDNDDDDDDDDDNDDDDDSNG
ncbi:hypothetical protein STEG23_016360, partial [Scotinomys teguina]